MFTKSGALLLGSTLAYTLLVLARAHIPTRASRLLWGALLGLITIIGSAALLCPTSLSYPDAASTRVVNHALRRLQQQAATADYLLFIDGSSISAHAIDLTALESNFSEKGLSIAIIPLINHAADHFEREWMANLLRKKMSPELRSIVDSKPTLWLKELYYQYEFNPARFALQNADTSRFLANSDTDFSPEMAKAIMSNWKETPKNLRDNLTTDLPHQRCLVVLDHWLYNLFQVGSLQRMLGISSAEYDVLAERARQPSHKGQRTWWKPHSEYVNAIKTSDAMSMRDWVRDLLETAPHGWPQRQNQRLVLFMAPGKNLTIQKYSATLASEGTGTGLKLINAPLDQELVQLLDKPTHWKDTIHLDHSGAAIFSDWLADRVSPVVFHLRSTQ